MNVIPVFVYGTLRSEGANFPLVSGSLVKAPVPAVLRGGYRLHSAQHGQYPYLVPCERQRGQIRGELLFLNPEGYAFRAIYGMEVGAGYRAQTVEAYPQGAREPMKALVFVYEKSLGLGKFIRSGDWFAAAQQQFTRAVDADELEIIRVPRAKPLP